jgi:hypothetical protein
MSDPNSKSSDILSDGPVKIYIFRPVSHSDSHIKFQAKKLFICSDHETSIKITNKNITWNYFSNQIYKIKQIPTF